MVDEKLLTPEEWLIHNCIDDDWDRISENLKDFLYTSNAVKYMNDYAKYVRDYHDKRTRNN